MKLEDNVIRNFKVAKEYRSHTKNITGMDFFPDGKRLVTSGKDDMIVFYNCENGTLEGTVKSMKYGVDLIQFGNVADKVVHTSSKLNHTIRYLSLSKKIFLRYFVGHSEKVVSLCSTSNKQNFISCSLDKTMRLWDVRSPRCEGLLLLSHTNTKASFDPPGIIFALGGNSENIELYDTRSFCKPFVTFNEIPKTESIWTDLKFSGDGKTILITQSNFIYVLDSFTGNLLHTFSDFKNTSEIPLQASYSPDSKYIFSGSTNGRLHVWNLETGNKVCVFNSGRMGPIQCVQFNPKFTMLTSMCDNMIAFWLPLIE